MYCGIFPTFNMIDGIFRIIMSVPHNIVMDLDYVMYTRCERAKLDA